MFILSAQRDDDADAAFANYRAYLAANKTNFPQRAYALATSDWYLDFRYHHCPHDAWLEQLAIDESSSGERHEIRTVSITIKLLGAYHDGTIVIHYPQVYAYRFNSVSLDAGHRDWRYDELRINEHGQLVHEIEWCGAHDTGTWLIVASDIDYRWIPHDDHQFALESAKHESL